MRAPRCALPLPLPVRAARHPAEPTTRLRARGCRSPRFARTGCRGRSGNTRGSGPEAPRRKAPARHAWGQGVNSLCACAGHQGVCELRAVPARHGPPRGA